MKYKGFIYLLHFHKPLPTSGKRKVRHYLGFAENLEHRINQHRNGIKAHNALPIAFYQWKIGFVVAIVWQGTRKQERAIKNRKKNMARWCPECQKEKLQEKIRQLKKLNGNVKIAA